jgi:hypothetical protein
VWNNGSLAKICSISSEAFKLIMRSSWKLGQWLEASLDQKYAIDIGPRLLYICLWFVYFSLTIPLCMALAGPVHLFEIRFENSVTSSPLATFSM